MKFVSYMKICNMNMYFVHYIDIQFNIFILFDTKYSFDIETLYSMKNMVSQIWLGWYSKHFGFRNSQRIGKKTLVLLNLSTYQPLGGTQFVLLEGLRLQVHSSIANQKGSIQLDKFYSDILLFNHSFAFFTDLVIDADNM